MIINDGVIGGAVSFLNGPTKPATYHMPNSVLTLL
jgi:hypothetical protein